MHSHNDISNELSATKTQEISLSQDQLQELRDQILSEELIIVRPIFRKITGSLTAAVLLCQILYWHMPSKKKERKLTIERDGHYWIAKTNAEWCEEVGLTNKECRAAIDLLCQMEIIIKRVYEFNGAPTTHIRLNWEVYTKHKNEVLDKEISERISNNNYPFAQKGQMHLPNLGKSYSIYNTETAEQRPPPPFIPPDPKPDKPPTSDSVGGLSALEEGRCYDCLKNFDMLHEDKVRATAMSSEKEAMEIVAFCTKPTFKATKSLTNAYFHYLKHPEQMRDNRIEKQALLEKEKESTMNVIKRKHSIAKQYYEAVSQWLFDNGIRDARVFVSERFMQFGTTKGIMRQVNFTENGFKKKMQEAFNFMGWPFPEIQIPIELA